MASDSPFVPGVTPIVLLTGDNEARHPEVTVAATRDHEMIRRTAASGSAYRAVSPQSQLEFANVRRSRPHAHLALPAVVRSTARSATVLHLIEQSVGLRDQLSKRGSRLVGYRCETYSEAKSSTDRTYGASRGCSASFRANLSSPVMTCVSRRTARVRYVASYTVIPVLTASA